jgi:uncharacterized protein
MVEPEREIKFIVDANAGKLVRWLRLIGYDTLFFTGADDSEMVAIALRENRVLVTRDTHIVERRVARNGQLRVILVESDDPPQQIRQVIETLKLDCHYRHFMLCLECNCLLVPQRPEDVKGRVPPYVFQTQSQYMECPNCYRIYWRGTHWQEMAQKIAEFCAAAQL